MTEERADDLGSFIRSQRRAAHLSLRRLAEIAGVSNPYLSQIERGLRRPSASILRQVASGLSISPEALFVRAGLLDAPDQDVDVIAEIMRDPHLRPEHRRALVDVYRSFRAEAAGDTTSESPEGPPR